jgi:hypothetical protein
LANVPARDELSAADDKPTGDGADPVGVEPHNRGMTRIVVWNMNHHASDHREAAWAYLRGELHADLVLVQEAVPPATVASVHRSGGIDGRDGKRRAWGSAVVSLNANLPLTPVVDAEGEWRGRSLGRSPLEAVRRGHMAVAVTSLAGQPVTLVSLYGVIEFGYSSGTILRAIADLEPLLDDPTLGNNGVASNATFVNNAIENTYNFAHYKFNCTAPLVHAHPYKWVADNVSDFLSPANPSVDHHNYTYCGFTHAAGQTVKTTTARAVTVGAGIHLPWPGDLPLGPARLWLVGDRDVQGEHRVELLLDQRQRARAVRRHIREKVLEKC